MVDNDSPGLLSRTSGARACYRSHALPRHGRHPLRFGCWEASLPRVKYNVRWSRKAASFQYRKQTVSSRDIKSSYFCRLPNAARSLCETRPELFAAAAQYTTSSSSYGYSTQYPCQQAALTVQRSCVNGFYAQPSFQRQSYCFTHHSSQTPNAAGITLQLSPPRASQQPIGFQQSSRLE